MKSKILIDSQLIKEYEECNNEIERLGLKLNNKDYKNEEERTFLIKRIKFLKKELNKLKQEMNQYDEIYDLGEKKIINKYKKY